MLLFNFLIRAVTVIVISKCTLAGKIFNIHGKTALLTGGSRGIGFAIAEYLLKSGLKGLTLVNVNIENGRAAAKELNKKYGHGKVIFIPADVSNLEEFEDYNRDVPIDYGVLLMDGTFEVIHIYSYLGDAVTFKVSLDHWKTLDIVVNNAGVVNEENLKSGISTNIMGTLHGTLLGFKYMSESKGGAGGVIINIASTTGIDPLHIVPLYSATKNFIIGLSRSLGHQVYYEHNKVRVLTLCPGMTDTDMIHNAVHTVSNYFNPDNKDQTVNLFSNAYLQGTDKVGEALVHVIEEGSSGSVWVVEDDQPPYEIKYRDRKSMQKKN